MNKLLLPFFLAFLLTGCTGSTENSTTNHSNSSNTSNTTGVGRQKTPVLPIILTSLPPEEDSVSAEDILKEFKDNELRGDQKYRGKRIFVFGVVSKVDRELLGEGYVLNLQSGKPYEILSVSAHGIPNNALSRVVVGKRAEVICDFRSGGDLGVTLDKCVLALFQDEDNNNYILFTNGEYGRMVPNDKGGIKELIRENGEVLGEGSTRIENGNVTGFYLSNGELWEN